MNGYADREVMNEEVWDTSQQERNLALACHLSTFAGYVFPFGNIIAPLVIYLVKKDESAFVRFNAAEALNFQITITLLFIISVILAFVLVGFLLMLILAIFDLIVTIMATVRASEGKTFFYPLSMRFVS